MIVNLHSELVPVVSVDDQRHGRARHRTARHSGGYEVWKQNLNAPDRPEVEVVHGIKKKEMSCGGPELNVGNPKSPLLLVQVGLLSANSKCASSSRPETEGANALPKNCEKECCR